MVDKVIRSRSQGDGTPKDVVDQIIHELQKIHVIKEADAEALKHDFERSDVAYIEDFLLEEGLVEEEQLLQVLQTVYGVRSIDVMGELFDHDLLKQIPKDVLLRNCCLPFRKEGDDILYIITANPANEDLEGILRSYVSYDIEFLVGIPHHIDMMIKDFYQDPVYPIDYEYNIEEAGEELEHEREEDEHKREDEEGEFGD